jgi:hypothetical protein
MTPEEDKVISLQFDNILDAIKNQAAQQELKDKNIMLKLENLSRQVQANMELITMVTDRDRKDLLKTLHNTEITNGRVTKLETTRNDHIVNCPRIPEIKEINKAIEDVTFWSRHPNLFIAVVAVCVIISIIGFINSIPK